MWHFPEFHIQYFSKNIDLNTWNKLILQMKYKNYDKAHFYLILSCFLDNSLL